MTSVLAFWRVEEGESGVEISALSGDTGKLETKFYSLGRLTSRPWISSFNTRA